MYCRDAELIGEADFRIFTDGLINTSGFRISYMSRGGDIGGKEGLSPPFLPKNPKFALS